MWSIHSGPGYPQPNHAESNVLVSDDSFSINKVSNNIFADNKKPCDQFPYDGRSDCGFSNPK